MKHILNTVNGLKRFARREEGNITLELVFIIPALFWIFLVQFAIFDAYRQHAINQKAAYSIGDIVSRQTDPIDPDFMNGMRSMLKYLTHSTNSDTSIRVSSLKYDANKDIYKRDWSKVKGNIPNLSNNDVKNWHGRLPVMIHNERVVVVETFVDYDPPFDTGIGAHTIENFVVTSPRYAPSVKWDCLCN